MNENCVPSRPRFSWDLRNAPWTDGKGNQERFYESVKQWCAFHDNLPNTNPNKIPSSLQGMLLQSQLYGRARDICLKMSAEDIKAADGAMKIAHAIHKSDSLAVVNDAFQKFQDLLSVSRGSSETMVNFEGRFDAALCRLNAVCKDSQLPESIVSFLALAHANIDSSQRMSILASVLPKSSSSSTETPLENIRYADVASLIRACDVPKELSNIESLSVSTIRTPVKPRKKHLSSEQLKDLKSKSKCYRCNNVGHWASDGICPKKIHKKPVYNRDNGNEASQSTRSPKKTGVLKFGMANLKPSFGYLPNAKHVNHPCVDDGAPYSGLGEVEADNLFADSGMYWRDCIEPIPKHIASRPYWQYGAGDHSSCAKPIIGSIMLQAVTDSENVVEIRHLVIEGSSQWVIGRNITSKTNIVHIGGNYILLPNGDTISMFEEDLGLHSYLPSSIFRAGEKLTSLVCLLATQGNTTKRSWSDVTKIIDKVHKHVCGHSNFMDIKTLLERNGIWSERFSKYLSSILDTCHSCRATQKPVGMRKVSLSNLNANFNRVINIDHFFLDEEAICHVMDTKTRYSVGQIVPSTANVFAIETLESRWISEFWPPCELQYDSAFATKEFENFLNSYEITKRRVPARRHNKLALESKHKIIRDIFIRLKDANPSVHKAILVYKAVRISNDLYGNEVLSAHEQAKGYTRPVDSSSPVTVPQDLFEAQEELISKRKLNAILRSQSISEPKIKVGDLVDVYIHPSKSKRGHWSQSKPVLKIDLPGRVVTVSGSGGKLIHAAFEDVRHALKNELAVEVQEALDILSESVESAIDEHLNNDNFNNDSRTQSSCSDDKCSDVDVPVENTNPVQERSPFPDNHSTEENQNDASNSIADEVSSKTGRIGSRELKNLATGPKWGLSSQIDVDAPQMQTRGSSSQHAHEIELTPGCSLTSQEQKSLQAYYHRFGSTEFLLHQAEGLSPWTTQNSYEVEEEKFQKAVKCVHIRNIPKNANIIRSHVLYKVKVLDDNSLMMRARIAPHGNEDRERYSLKSDSETCSPLGIRVLISVCVLKKWYLTKVDIASAFLQSGPAERDVYVVPPRESSNRDFYWLLLAASYGLVNGNAKWQVHSDNTFYRLGLSNVRYIPQLFYLRQGGNLVLIVLKVVDDMLIGGSNEKRMAFTKRLKSIYKLGTIVHSPGCLKFFGSEIQQSEDYEIEFHSDGKLAELQPHVISRNRRRESESALSSVEKTVFNSTNGSLGFIGSMSSPLAAFFTSHLQQRRSIPIVRDFTLQNNLLKQVARFGTSIKYSLPEATELPVSVVMFSDAARPSERGQLGFIGGLLLGDMSTGSIFHTVSWRSSLSSRPVKSIGSAEVLAAGSAVDEGKLIVSTYSELLGIPIHLLCAVDSKDLYSSLSTCHVPEDKSIRGDVALIRYDFERKFINDMMWIPGSTNPSDALTKVNSALTDALHVMLATGKIPICFEQAERRSSDAYLG